MNTVIAQQIAEQGGVEAGCMRNSIKACCVFSPAAASTTAKAR